MNPSIEKYIDYVRTVRRYSERTVSAYSEILSKYDEFSGGNYSKNALRAYEVHLLDEKGLGARTVNQRLSVLSGYCRFLVKEGELESNPMRLLPRPRQPKRIPLFFRQEALAEYFESHKGTLEFGSREAALRFLAVDILFSTGLRRSELISLTLGSVDFSRRVIRVRGKGDKVREVPMTESLARDLQTYLERFGQGVEPAEPLLLTSSGSPLYPVWVDRAVKQEMGGVDSITTRKSPHVLRHTIATELLDEGADLNSIKELLGHTSLAATQVYTHSTIERLKGVYLKSHPRSKK